MNINDSYSLSRIYSALRTMSFWGAMVITSLLGAIPAVGNDLLFMLWGSYTIDNATLIRFYSLHFTLPFIILILTILHFVLLHEFGSSNPLGLQFKVDYVPFMPYYGVKDAFSIILILIPGMIFVMWLPDALGHPDNFVPANPMVTPSHIVPEWYFLPMYAILRSVTNKLLGIGLILLSILCIMALPFLNKSLIIRSASFRPLYCVFVWSFFITIFLLGWIGSLPVIEPYLTLGQMLTAYYFLSVFVMLPLLNYFEYLIYLIYLYRNET